MNRITKTLAAIIAVLMLAATFTACAKPQGDTETSGDGDTSTATPETTSEFVNDDLSDDLKINDTVTFLYWKDVERPEFFVEESEDDGNIVNTRISERNKRKKQQHFLFVAAVSVKYHAPKHSKKAPIGFKCCRGAEENHDNANRRFFNFCLGADGKQSKKQRKNHVQREFVDFLAVHNAPRILRNERKDKQP